MRVCHVLPAYPDPAHGHHEGQNYRRFLERLTRAGTDVVAVTARQYRDSPTVHQQDSVPVRRFVFGEVDSRLGALPLSPRIAWNYYRTGLRAIADAHADRAVDVLHAHMPVPPGILALGARRRLRIPVVLTLHGSDVFVYARRNLALRWATMWALRRANCVTAVSEELAEEAARLVPGLQAQLIPMGYDEGAYHSGAPAAERTKRVVSTRNLWPLYSVDTLVRAARRQLADTDVRVDVYGDGPERGALERQAAGTPVEFHGFAEPATVSAALRRAAVYVSTSTSDGTSVSLLEAMACGAYPIVTDIPANRHWVRDGENGRLFPVGDADALGRVVREAMGDVDGRARAMGLNAARVAGVSWRNVIPRYQNVYETVRDGWKT